MTTSPKAAPWGASPAWSPSATPAPASGALARARDGSSPCRAAPEAAAPAHAPPPTAAGPAQALAVAPRACAKAAAAAPQPPEQATPWLASLAQAVRPALTRTMQRFAGCACGLGAVAGIGWLAAVSGATAALLRVFAGASILDRVGGSIYLIGPLLAVLMGVGGNFGFLSVSLIVQAFVDACFTGSAAGEATALPTGSDGAPASPWFGARAGAALNALRRLTGPLDARWLRAHAAVGLALSPLFLAPAGSCTASLLGGVALGIGYMSDTIQRARASATAPSFAHALFGISVGLALAPVGAQAVSGVAGLNILRQAVNFPLLALGCNAIVAAGRQIYGLFGTDAAARPGAEPVEVAGTTLYLGHNADAANVFIPLDVAQAVADIVRHHQANAARGIVEGARCLLLRAPQGTGKRQVAKAVAAALGTRMYVLDRARFAYLGREHAGQVLADQFKRWQQEAHRLGRPLVLYVPELLRLAPKVTDAAAGGGQGGRAEAPKVADEFVSQLKTLMANESGGQKSNLLFVLGTAASREVMRAQVDDAIQNRISRTLRWREPDATTLSLLWASHLRAALRGSVVHPQCYAEVLGPQLTAFLRQNVCAPARLSHAERVAMTGEEVAARITQAVDATVQAYLRERAPDLAPDEADLRFALALALDGQLKRAFDHWIDAREGHPDDSSEDAYSEDATAYHGEDDDVADASDVGTPEVQSSVHDLQASRGHRPATPHPRAS